MHAFISAAILFSVFAFVRGLSYPATTAQQQQKLTLLITLLKTYNAQKVNPTCMLVTSMILSE